MRNTKPTTYKTLKGLMKATDTKVITAEMMASKHTRFADGWFYNFKITEELENEFWTECAKVVWKRPTERQINLLKYAKSWMLQRLMYDNGRYSYCAGQDYPGELRSIQNYINRM